MSTASSGPEVALVAQDLGARLAVDVLHDDELALGGLVEPEVEHLHDVGVHEAGGGQRLAAEARDEVRVLGEVLGQQLDRDVALQARVEGQLHGRHPAGPQAALESVAVGEELVGHPSSPGTPVPAARLRRGRLGRRRRRRRGLGRRSASPSASRSASASASGSRWPTAWPSASASLRRLAVLRHALVEVVEPVGQVLAQPLRRAARQLGTICLASSTASRGLRAVAARRRAGRPRRPCWRADRRRTGAAGAGSPAAAGQGRAQRSSRAEVGGCADASGGLPG